MNNQQLLTNRYYLRCNCKSANNMIKLTTYLTFFFFMFVTKIVLQFFFSLGKFYYSNRRD